MPYYNVYRRNVPSGGTCKVCLAPDPRYLKIGDVWICPDCRVVWENKRSGWHPAPARLQRAAHEGRI